MNKILCFVNRKLVEKNVFFSEFKKATNDMEFYEVEEKQELISTLGYQNVNGVDFHIVDLEDKQLGIYDNAMDLEEEERDYIFDTFKDFVESLEDNIDVAREYDLEDMRDSMSEEDYCIMDKELTLEYALEEIFLKGKIYYVNDFTYYCEDIEE